MNTSIRAIALVAALAVQGVASADPSTTKMAVHYSDLNLASPAGIAALNSRIKNAVDQVCGSADSRQLEEVAAVNECKKAALADAMAQVAMISTPRSVAAR